MPDISVNPMHRFFLKVAGDSMDLLYPHGTFVECISSFGLFEIESGKRYVVLRRREDQRIEATLKELVEIDGVMWLVPRSSNPSHQAFRLDEPGEGIEEIQIIAKVVASVRTE